jgi:hypothetical protein
MVVSGPKKVTESYQQNLVKLTSMRLCANALSQLVIPTALCDENTPSSMVSKGGRIFEQREATVTELSKISSISFVKNKAAFYVFPRLDCKKLNITDDKKTETTDSKEPKPKDEYASFVSKENGGDHFDSIKAMQTGEIKILNGKDDSDILLVVKKDVNEDPYYLEEYDLQFRHELKDEEFADIVAKCKKGLKMRI